ncbi:MAG: hypothetical protein WAN50_04910 [Minisyncoccia bacterium]
MKKITTILAALFFVVPSVSFAAALTPQQSNSLIAVVQASPGTPANAFVSLITAFSNISVTQATSLITVIQAAPGVPASAFVSLLTSFTADTTATQTVTPVTNPISTTQPVTSTATWHQAFTFSGSGTSLTNSPQFTLHGKEQRIDWSCSVVDASLDISNFGANIQATQDYSGDSIASDETCPTSKTTYEYDLSPGQYYLQLGPTNASSNRH